MTERDRVDHVGSGEEQEERPATDHARPEETAPEASASDSKAGVPDEEDSHPPGELGQTVRELGAEGEKRPGPGTVPEEEV